MKLYSDLLEDIKNNSNSSKNKLKKVKNDITLNPPHYGNGIVKNSHNQMKDIPVNSNNFLAAIKNPKQ
jgi:hypothetical protein